MRWCTLGRWTAGRARGTRGWVTVMLLLIGTGVGGSAVAGQLVAQSDAGRVRLAFASDAAQVASTLRLAIQHEEDLVVGGRAFVSRNPAVSTSEFDEWGESNEALKRFPELQDIGLIAPVPAAGLTAFRDRMIAHPVLPLDRQTPAFRGQFTVLPVGGRPTYCFAVAGLVRRPVATLPPGLDYCAVEPSLLRARDSGLSSYLPLKEGGMTTLAVQTPVYRPHLPLTRCSSAGGPSSAGWVSRSPPSSS